MGLELGLEWPRMECAKSRCLTLHGFMRLTGCAPQPPDFVPPHVVSHACLPSAGRQLSGGRAAWAAVGAHHLPQG